MSAGERAPRRAWIALGVLALACVVYAMDLTVLTLALPRLATHLHATQIEQLWIVDVYGFLVAGALLPMGALGDRIGRRRLLLAGAAAFAITSIVAATATSATTLIASRAVLGIAGASFAPSTLALVRDLFPRPADRSFAVGIWIASYSTGSAIGPVVGGAVLEHFAPGAVFLLALPVMLLLLVLGPRLLPETEPAPGTSIPWTSAILLLGAVLTTVFGIKRLAASGLSSLGVASAAVGLATAAFALRRESRLAEPLVDLRLFRDRAFAAALGGYALATFVVFGISVAIEQHLQLVLRLSPLEAGLVMVPVAIAFTVGSLSAPVLARRVDRLGLIAGGIWLACAGFVLVAIGARSPSFVTLMVGTVLFGLGLAPTVALATDLVVASAPPAHAGAAAALSETASELGGALGIALLGSLGAAVFREDLGSAVAIDSLAAALDHAASLPTLAGVALAGSARAAATHALATIGWTSAAVAFTLGVAATAALRRKNAPGHRPRLVNAL